MLDINLDPNNPSNEVIKAYPGGFTISLTHELAENFLTPLRENMENVKYCAKTLGELIFLTDGETNSTIQSVKDFDASKYFFDEGTYKNYFERVMEGVYRRHITGLNKEFGKEDIAEQIAEKTGMTLGAADYIHKLYQELKIKNIDLFDPPRPRFESLLSKGLSHDVIADKSGYDKIRQVDAIKELKNIYDELITNRDDAAKIKFLGKDYQKTIETVNNTNDNEATKIKNIVTKYKVDPDRPIITQVSRFDPWKDPLGVIDMYRMAKREVKDVQLVLIASMANDDPEGWEYYEKTARHAGEDYDIHLLSNLNGVGNLEVNAFQRASDVIIQKSLREGFGLVITEALWKGKPVVAANVGGIPLQVDNRRTGFLVGDISECAERVIHLLKDPEIAHKMGTSGKEYVRKNFLITRLLKDYLNLFNSL